MNSLKISSFYFLGILLDVDDVTSFCPSVYDGILCWPRTKAGDKVFLQCPDGVRGLDHESKLSYQRFWKDLF